MPLHLVLIGTVLLSLLSAPQLSIAADDEAELRATVEKFFAACARKDLNALLSLWSEKSPEIASQKQAMQQLFDAGDLTFTSPAVSRLKVEADRASLRATLHLNRVDARTKQRRSQLLVQNFELRQEGAHWKVWHYGSATDDLAALLAAAKSREETASLLATERELVTPELTSALNNLGIRHGSRGDYQQALAIFHLAQGIAEQNGDKPGVGRSLVNAAVVHRYQGRYGLAMECYERSLRLFEELDNKAGTALVLGGMGQVEYSQGNYAQALTLHLRRLKLSEELKDSVGVARGLENLGNVYKDQGSYALAVEFYESALKSYGELGDQENVAGTLNNIGIVQTLKGDYTAALESFQKSLALSEAVGSKTNLSETLNNIGIVHKEQGRYDLAVDFYQRSLKLAEELGEKGGIAEALGNIGIAHHEQGASDPALEFLQKALGIAEEIGEKARIAETLHNIGTVRATRGDLAMASALYQRSLELSEKIGDKAGMAQTLGAIGDALISQDKPVQALEYYKRGLSIAETIDLPSVAYLCSKGIGDVESREGRKEEAIASYRKAISFLERIRSHVAGGEEERLLFLHSKDRYVVYQSLISLLTARGMIADALSHLERAKSKQLLDGFRLQSLTVRDANLRALLAKSEDLELGLSAQERMRLAEISLPEERQNKTKLANLTRLVADTRAALLQVNNSIRDANPDYERFITVKVPDLKVIQDNLPSDAVVVEYLPLETALTIFLVTNRGAQARTVAVSRKRLDELVQAFRDEMLKAGSARGSALLSKPNAETSLLEWDWQSNRARRLRATLTTLYGYLIAPIQNDLRKVESMVIVPSGSLYYLPFQALARESSDKSLKFLVEEKRLAMLPSLQLWNQIARKESASGASKPMRLAAFGNPDGSLPGAEDEVKQLGVLFPDSIIYIGAEATRARVENLPQDVNVAHFATHGRLSEQDINECHLVLANGEKLKLGEIYGLAGNYSAKMTVLSACETAMGRKDPGNEVANLAEGFVEAGSTTILATLWQVCDASTSLLMARFYREIKIGKSKAEAMRLAETSLLKSRGTAHPYFWAPFVLIGNWK